MYRCCSAQIRLLPRFSLHYTCMLAGVGLQLGEAEEMKFYSLAGWAAVAFFSLGVLLKFTGSFLALFVSVNLFLIKATFLLYLLSY